MYTLVPTEVEPGRPEEKGAARAGLSYPRTQARSVIRLHVCYTVCCQAPHEAGH